MEPLYLASTHEESRTLAISTSELRRSQKNGYPKFFLPQNLSASPPTKMLGGLRICGDSRPPSLHLSGAFSPSWSDSESRAQLEQRSCAVDEVIQRRHLVPDLAVCLQDGLDHHLILRNSMPACCRVCASGRGCSCHLCTETEEMSDVIN